MTGGRPEGKASALSNLKFISKSLNGLSVAPLETGGLNGRAKCRNVIS